MKHEFERRTFVKLLGGALSSMALPACSTTRLASVRGTGAAADGWSSLRESFIASTCSLCPGGCGVLARVIDGRLVKLEGNPQHPVNRGKLCPLGQTGPQLLYHPDRVKTPLRRTGGKESDRWVEISWDEALSLVGGRLKQLRENGTPHLLAVMNGKSGGLMEKLLRRFCEAYGTPNFIDATEPDPANLAVDLMQGIKGPVSYDFRNVDYLLAFGADFLNGGASPVHNARSYAYLRQRRNGRKAKIVYVGPRFSTTAARADAWVPVRPGTEAALALAIAYVLIREELYDREFVEGFTDGLGDWEDAKGVRHLGFKNLVMRHYRPDDVSALTGTPIDTIISLAKELGQNRPALAVPGRACLHSSNPVYTAMAIHSLNGLMGGIETAGGVLINAPVPFQPLPDIPADLPALKGRAMPPIDARPAGSFPLAENLPDLVPVNILSGVPYTPEVLIFHHSDPIASSPVGSACRAALKKIPLVVSICTFPDETSKSADLILPDHLFLEKWSDVTAAPVDGIPVVGITQPVVKPVFNTKAAGDIVLTLAERMGGTVARSFPWADFQELLRYSIKGIHEAGLGATFAEEHEEAYVRELQRRGWATGELPSFEDFWTQLVKEGGWSGLFHEERIGHAFNTTSGKFEFYSHGLEARLEASAQAAGRKLDDLFKDLGIQTDAEVRFLPHHETPSGGVDHSVYPLHLHAFDLLTQNSPLAVHAPWVQELASQDSRAAGWIEMNPETAAAVAVADGDWVWVESGLGRMRFRARLYPGAMPAVVNLPANLVRPASRGLKGIENESSKIAVECDSDKLTGLWSKSTLAVRLYKAG